MAITDALLPEFDHEMGVTRRLLERVPEKDFAWKPHDKSYSLGALSTHIANLLTWGGIILDGSELDLAGVSLDAWRKVPATTSELIALFDRNVKETRAAIVSKTDAEYRAMWTLRKGGQIIFTLPRIAALRGSLMNHVIHHRGQLSVYLRLRNVPLPAMYGPSADEGAS